MSEGKKIKNLPGYDNSGVNCYEYTPENEHVEEEKKVQPEEFRDSSVAAVETIKMEEGAKIFDHLKKLERESGIHQLHEILSEEKTSFSDIQSDISKLQASVVKLISTDTKAADSAIPTPEQLSDLKSRISQLESTVGSESAGSQSLLTLTSKLDERSTLLDQQVLNETLDKLHKMSTSIDSILSLNKKSEMTIGRGGKLASDGFPSTADDLSKLIEEYLPFEQSADVITSVMERLLALRSLHDSAHLTTTLVREADSLRTSTDAILSSSLQTLSTLSEQSSVAARQAADNTASIQKRISRLNKNIKLLEKS